MIRRKSFLQLLIFVLFSMAAQAIEIERFEQIDTKQGLSQNNVLSMFCDHDDFMWFGTMDGLNRYDGYSFKIIKSETGKKNVLTNNRISKIWEDQLHFLWVKTYDGYYHYYLRETGDFMNFPDYHEVIEEKNSIISCYLEDEKGSIWLGTTNSGLYHLKFDETTQRYQSIRFNTESKNILRSNSITFLINDENGRVWAGTNKGLHLISADGNIQSFLPEQNITCGSIHGHQLYLGTESKGIIIFHTTQLSGEELAPSLKTLSQTGILFIENIDNEFLLFGTPHTGLAAYQLNDQELKVYHQFGNEAQYIFKDNYGLIWLKTEQYGIVKIELRSGKEKHFDLSKKDLRSIIDDERPFLYEDQNKNLWIGTHGGGLALYERTSDSFTFYRNDPLSNNTLSSDFVHCIGEDRSGLLWVGTGQINGGANKVILSNPSFTQISPKKKLTNLSDNAIRCVFEDSNKNTWMASKSGAIYIYNQQNELITSIDNIHLLKKDVPGYNVYSIIEDHEGYIWMGSKGGGVLVSKTPIKSGQSFYKNLAFNLYQNQANVATSLSSNNVYSLLEDHLHQIWIGTYGGGLNKVISRSTTELVCAHINQQNSSLSSNDLRYLFEDAQGNLWVATVFGLNIALANEISKENPHFDVFFYDPAVKTSICYNDIIHIFEDSKKQLWFGTFGGGVSILKEFKGIESEFVSLKTNNGLSNDAVFSILEDRSGKIWMGTENGISSYLPARLVFENYDVNSGLYTNNYSENACCLSSSGDLLFGSVTGTLVIKPETIEKTQYAPKIAITNFQLNNRNIDINDPNSPIKQDIGTLKHLELNYNQSSFSFEYSALSFLAPNQNNYAFILENFENDWNYVGNQRKATYTNLSPGTYIFRVKASNWDGTWNEIPKQISITIHPPWWKSTWALIVYFVVSLVLLEIARRIFLKYYRMQNDLQVERRVNDIKLQFFTNISHEIRTPLTLILGPIDDIKANKHLPPDVRNRINIMERNGQRMLKLINQLLDFRKIQNKKMELKIEELNLGEFVQEICEHFTPVARHKQIDFQIKKTDKNILVFADPNKFDSVVFNLLSNAFKYSKQGKTILVEIFEPTETYVDIQISDEGTGIPEEKLKFLFQRFTPLSSDDHQLNGTGIGLSLAYEIMQLHKGDILVESVENQGSRFTIRMLMGNAHYAPDQIKTQTSNAVHHHQSPVQEENFDEAEKVIVQIPQDNSPLALVVEDHPEVLMYVCDSLKPNFKVETAINGKEGLAKLEYLHPDLIITDVMMPEMDGIEMCKSIKANFNTSHIPVIMLTAKSNMADQIEGVESGAEAYILKPFNSEYLRVVANNFIKQRELVIRKYRDKQVGDTFDTKITNKDDQFLKEIFGIIEQHFTDSEFNVEQLISISVYSRTVLYNKVKGLLGVSPVDLIRQVRLKHAARLISEGGNKISEAAYASGFNDPKYFRKCFKAMFGVNPTEYKQGG
ncbi:MAG: two-component regulator propeller domain-containing protein [Prolixibacteraceae bacterium]